MSWIADLLGHKDVTVDGGSPLARREIVNVTGGLTAVDDSANDASTISIGGAVDATFGAKILMAGNVIEAQGYTEVSVGPLSSQEDDYDPTGWGTCDVLVVTLTGNQSVTGFAAPSSTDTRRKLLINGDDTDTLTLENEDASSVLQNRIRGPGGADVLLGPRDSIFIHYVTALSLWIPVGL